MPLKIIDPAEARRLIAEEGAVLVDIREPLEHARENIPGARSAPLSNLSASELASCGGPVIFHCQSGNRTSVSADKLEACAPCEAYALKGGLNGWKAAGFASALDRSKPIEIQRQVQIVAGGLVLLGTVLAASLSAWFLALTAFVGAGLVFAGVSGWCGMAKLLAVLPWNRTAA